MALLKQQLADDIASAFKKQQQISTGFGRFRDEQKQEALQTLSATLTANSLSAQIIEDFRENGAKGEFSNIISATFVSTGVNPDPVDPTVAASNMLADAIDKYVKMGQDSQGGFIH